MVADPRRAPHPFSLDTLRAQQGRLYAPAVVPAPPAPVVVPAPAPVPAPSKPAPAPPRARRALPVLPPEPPANDNAAPLETPAEAAPSGGRHPRVRGRTVSIKRLSKRELDRGRAEADAALAELRELGVRTTRPTTRAECLAGGWNEQRPCPFVSCSWHLALDVKPASGAIKSNFPGRELEALEHSCALDVADLGEQTLEHVGALTNLTRERIRQFEGRALATFRVNPTVRSLRGEELALDAGDNSEAHDVPSVARGVLPDPVLHVRELDFTPTGSNLGFHLVGR